MLLAQSARVGEEEGPMMNLGMDVSQRAARCEHKVERVFRDVLGVEMDGTTTMDSMLGGLSEVLAQALLQEYTPKYQHARSTYLERNRVYNVADLQIGRLATPPVDNSDEDYVAKMQEEIQLLSLWKKRCSYERTNPERLEPGTLATHVRQAHKEMICVLTRHPEAWHMWSYWEITLSGVDNKLDYAVSVLELGQEHIPDSTLLAYAEVQLLERHTDTPSDGLAIMEKFLERCPNTLGFFLFQQLIRRYKGIKEARTVFARARRVLMKI
jgi:hypothetical protein